MLEVLLNTSTIIECLFVFYVSYMYNQMIIFLLYFFLPGC